MGRLGYNDKKKSGMNKSWSLLQPSFLGDHVYLDWAAC